MELQPAGGWRVETGQVVSEVTERLLAWMTGVQGTLSRAQTAANIGQGLLDLLQAEGAAVLVRDGGRLAPMWLSWRENRRSEDREEAPTMENLDGGLLAVVGDAPFFSDTATAPVQILLGDACDILFETGAPTLTKPDNSRDTSLYAMAQQATMPELPSLVVPLATGNGVEGIVLLWIATHDGLVGDEYRAPVQAAARQGGAMLAASRACELGGSAERDFSVLLAEAADMREPYRVGHSPNVAHWCGVIARGMNLSESDVEHCELAGLLHGMGKITVPDEILQKGFALSEDERALVRKAIVSGGDRLMQVRGLEEVALAVRHQGECWNGSGLPDALTGDAIPLGARILAVALRFCAMTRSRAGRRAMSIVGGAFETIANDAGKALDPKVVRAFLATMGRTMDVPRITIADNDVLNDK